MCTTTTTKAKVARSKLSGIFEKNVELNQNTICVCRLWKGRISNILGTAYGIKLKLSGHFESDIELTQIHYAHTTTATAAISSNNTITIVNGTTCDCDPQLL